MLEAADGGDLAAASVQIERALLLDVRVEVCRTPA